MNELTHHDESRALAEHRPSDNFLAQILAAAADPTVDAAKVETMANLAIKLQDRERETQFAQDFAAALMEMPTITKQGEIIIPGKDGKPSRVQGKFAKYEDIDAVTKPILARYNMVISFKLGSADGGLTTATPILTHRNGYRDIGEALRVPLDSSGSKNNAQGVGSSSTYAKRYALCAALNIVTIGEDTDGRYPLPDDPLTDLQQRIAAEAAQSAADGNYSEWYGRQSPKDRAWLINTGRHAQFGGQAALPDSRSAAPAGGDVSRVGGALDQGDSEARRLAEDWLSGYESEVESAMDRGQLIEVQRKKGRAIEKMKAEHPDLHKKVIEANRAALERLDGESE